MRCGMIVIALFTLLANPALAATAYDDVPKEHWSYHALDYLSRNEILEGYPGGFFRNERTLTRYELAQAIARMLDSIGGEGEEGEDTIILAEALSREYRDVLNEICGGSRRIPIDDWQYDALEHLANMGFLQPIFATPFDRDKKMSYFQMEKYAQVVKQVFDLGKPDSVSYKDWKEAFGLAYKFVEEYNLHIARDGYEVIRRDHWSYDALDYLSQNGELVDYPEGFFAGDRTLTGYEFAQAIVRLLDSMGGESDESVIILAEALRETYSEQVAELRRPLSETSQKIQRYPLVKGNSTATTIKVAAPSRR